MGLTGAGCLLVSLSFLLQEDIIRAISPLTSAQGGSLFSMAMAFCTELFGLFGTELGVHRPGGSLLPIPAPLTRAEADRAGALHLLPGHR